MADIRDTITNLRTEAANTEVRLRRLHEAIRQLEGLTGQPEGHPAHDPSNPKPYSSMTYGDAAMDVIGKMGPRSTRDLAELLLDGGALTKSRNFVATLYSLLYKDGRFILNKQKQWEIKAKR